MTGAAICSAYGESGTLRQPLHTRKASHGIALRQRQSVSHRGGILPIAEDMDKTCGADQHGATMPNHDRS